MTGNTPDAYTTFWLVWSPTGHRPPRYRHGSEQSARCEAERLALENAGHEFFVLESKAHVRALFVTWTEHVQPKNEIPF
jgi:hypothetical protein